MATSLSDDDLQLGRAAIHDAFALLPSGGVMDERDTEMVRALLSYAEALLGGDARDEHRVWVRANVHPSTESHFLRR